MKYILDLERINQLTAPHPGDNSNGYQPTVVFSDSVTEKRDKDKLFIRDRKLDKILDENL